MANRRDPERREILRGQLGKNLEINVVVAEDRCVLAQADALPAMPQYPRAFSQAAVEALLTGHYIANRKVQSPPCGADVSVSRQRRRRAELRGRLRWAASS